MNAPVFADDVQDRLASWLTKQIADADADAEEVQVAGLDRVELGHSAETLLVTVTWRSNGAPRSTDGVIRIRPPEPGLLPPYDLKRQFDILRCLESTPVRAPRALWFEPTGDVLGRDFYVMERLRGSVHERVLPDELAADASRIRRMCENMIEQLAAIHKVDLEASGLAALGDGHGYLDRELDHWAGEIRRVQRGPLPALERLHALLREQQPPQCPSITLVHGDPKAGNVAFEGSEVTGIFDWEMAGIGDPLADLGWAEVLWNLGPSITNLPSSPSAEEFVARWEELTGIRAEHREWYRAFQIFKMCTIQLVAGHLFDVGYTDDPRFGSMTRVIEPMTQRALQELGFEDHIEAGPVLPREERLAAVARQAQHG